MRIDVAAIAAAALLTTAIVAPSTAAFAAIPRPPSSISTVPPKVPAWCRFTFRADPLCNPTPRPKLRVAKVVAR